MKRQPRRNPMIDPAMAAPSRWLIRLLFAIAALLVPTYFFLQQVSSGSWVVTVVNLTVGALTGLWSTVMLIALSFDKREDLFVRIRATYLNALRMQWLVWISFLLLAAAEALLLDELLGARTVEVPTEASVKVLLNDQPGNIVLLGTVKGAACDEVPLPSVRVPIGKHIIVFQSIKSGEPIAFYKLQVRPFWQGAIAPTPCIRREHEVHYLN